MLKLVLTTHDQHSLQQFSDQLKSIAQIFLRKFTPKEAFRIKKWRIYITMICQNINFVLLNYQKLELKLKRLSEIYIIFQTLHQFLCASYFTPKDVIWLSISQTKENKPMSGCCKPYSAGRGVGKIIYSESLLFTYVSMPCAWNWSKSMWWYGWLCGV